MNITVTRRTCRRVAVLLATLLALCSCASAVTGDLQQGKDLTAVTDPADIISGLIGQKLKAGRIDKVTVSEDSERRLTVHISGSRLAGKSIVADVLGASREAQPQIPSKKTSLDADAADITLDLDPAAPEGTEVTSGFLHLTVTREQLSVAEAEQFFALPKKWKRAFSPENVVLQVGMRPEGAAAQLREQPVVVRPQLLMIKPMAFATPVAVARPVAAPAATLSMESDTDRAGMDYNGSNLSAADPNLCKQLCGNDSRCKAYTYVKPGVQGPTARCYLKSPVPNPARNTCCVSGVKTATATVPPPPPPAYVAPAPAIARAVAPAASRATAQPILPVATATLMLNVSKFQFGMLKKDEDNGAQGPAEMPLDLISQIGYDAGEDPSTVMRIWPQVYMDKNPASGVFYFMPKAYHVKWDRAEGYGLRMVYGAANADGQAGSVMMAARLDSGVDSDDIAFVTDLLKAWKNRNQGSVFTALRRLPIVKPPEISLAGGLQQVYNIPSDKIAVNAISDALGQIDVQWSTDTVTKENLQAALLANVGITGTLSFTPAGGALEAQRIPVAIRLADSSTFGDFRWKRGEKWRNTTPYPIQLRYMHALLFDNDLPIVYSWSLGDTNVPPKAQAQFDAAAVPSWLEGRAKRMWLDYVVVQNCDSCDRDVIASITGGVSTMGSTPITFHTLTPLGDIGAAEMSVQVRSRYFDPRNRDVQEKGPLVLNADSKDFTIGPLYQDPQASGPLFEYQIQVVMKDGTTYNGTNWVAADEARVVIGKAQVKKSLGQLPPQ